MKVRDHVRRNPFTYCTTLDGKAVHLRIPVHYHQVTLCRRVVVCDGFSGKPSQRRMCEKCLRKEGTLK